MTVTQVAQAQQMRDEGMVYEQIGAALGIPPKTVYYRLNDAYRKRQSDYMRQYRATHETPDISEYRTTYMATYRPAHKAEHAQYIHDHLPEHNARNAARRALKRGALAGATINQLIEIKEIYRRAKEDLGVRCYLCGKLIPKGHRHVDHITPLSKGGAHRPSNLAVACDECNLEKYNKLPEEIGVLL